MKKTNILLGVIMLALASLACQTVTGAGNETAEPPNVPEITEVPQGNENDAQILPTSAIPTAPTDTGGDGDTTGGQTDFPLPGDSFNVLSMGNDIVNFQTKLSLDEAMSFYRDEFGKLDYSERDLLTVTSDNTFSMVFDGHESGKAITLQGVDLGDGTVNISIALVDI